MAIEIIAKTMAVAVCGTLGAVLLIQASRLIAISRDLAGAAAAYGFSMCCLALYYAFSSTNEYLASAASVLSLAGGAALPGLFGSWRTRTVRLLVLVGGAISLTLLLVSSTPWPHNNLWVSRVVVVADWIVALAGLFLLRRGILELPSTRSWIPRIATRFEFSIGIYVSLETVYLAWLLMVSMGQMPPLFVMAFTVAKLSLYPFLCCALGAEANPERPWPWKQ